MKQVKKLEALLNELENKISDYEYGDPAISKGSVGWHIEHSLLTLNLVIDVLKKSNPDQYRWTFNLKRSYVVLLGKIPRGKIKAPAPVRPSASYNLTSLLEHIKLSKDKIKSLKGLQPNHFFKHPFLGNMNYRQTVKFLQIHTSHHLGIINDIIKNKTAS